MPSGSNHSTLVGAGYLPGLDDCETFVTTAIAVLSPGDRLCLQRHDPNSLDVTVSREFEGDMHTSCTVRGIDGAVALPKWYEKPVYLVSPSVYRYHSHAFSLSYFYLNSDFFVVVYMVTALLDEYHGLYVFLGGVVLITRNGSMLFGNSGVVYLTTTTQRLDGISLNMFDSTLVRNYPSLAIVIFVNLFVVLSVDGLVHHQWRRLL
ncbi:hypothetical protein DYB31_016081 [Aphanomyces astaci]|uniref:Uncharacterized protein n=1 Tax=Aphanomyces astaci TaxID=112090 RepID=A0A397EH23_APHAT|nr:hypothetical protein DYB31_016081 [Aphanomyces astaci]